MHVEVFNYKRLKTYSFLQHLFVDILYVNEVAGQDDASKTVSNEIRTHNITN